MLGRCAVAEPPLARAAPGRNAQTPATSAQEVPRRVWRAFTARTGLAQVQVRRQHRLEQFAVVKVSRLNHVADGGALDGTGFTAEGRTLTSLHFGRVKP